MSVYKTSLPLALVSIWNTHLIFAVFSKVHKWLILIRITFTANVLLYFTHLQCSIRDLYIAASCSIHPSALMIFWFNCQSILFWSCFLPTNLHCFMPFLFGLKVFLFKYWSNVHVLIELFMYWSNCSCIDQIIVKKYKMYIIKVPIDSGLNGQWWY